MRSTQFTKRRFSLFWSGIASLTAKKVLAVMAVSMCCVVAPATLADSCRPDASGRDAITKKQMDQWQQVLSSSGFLAAALMDHDVTFTAYVKRVGDSNFILVSIQKVEENLARAAFESHYHASNGDQLTFGFKDGDPLSFVVTEVANQAQADMFGKLNMSVVWAAEVAPNDLATMRVALTTKQIDAIRITQAAGAVDEAVPDKNGKKLMEKFGCFYQALDKSGVDLTTKGSASRSASAAQGGSVDGQDSSPQLDLVVEDILAQDKLTLQAMLHHDSAYLDKHIADDAIFTKSGGKKQTKRMLIAEIMEQQAPPVAVKSRYSSVSSTVTGDTVEVTSTATLSAQMRGGWKDFEEVRSTTKYKKVNGEWVMLGGSNAYEKQLR
ncbi:MAG TPA: nuclear transport factor 2 family protein [Thermoanaerobaculia bacterium]|jgi:hypothetical protein|nr:nuclear transport factor 2 family protein [Thermoanaerobaculia bacterium]